jgi:hypothetical protein
MPVILILVLMWLVSVPAGSLTSQQDTPATTSTQSQPSAPAETQQAPPPKGDSPAGEPGTSDDAAKKKAQVAPHKNAKRHRVRKNVEPSSPGQPRRIVVREGGATAPPAQIVPGMTPEQASQQRQEALDLLTSTEQNLKQLAGRTLDSHQQETVAQIHNYKDGARSALHDGDSQRAHTLALKAYLLADDLVKH